MRVRGDVLVHAPLDATWDALADLASHVEWMADAESITFLGEQRRGVGTAFECLTRVGPLTTRDKMTVTEWVERDRITVAHRGIVRGTGTFELAAAGEDTTRVSWTEDLRFPPYLGAAAGALVAKPILRRIWRGNLSRFGTRVEQGYRK